MPCGGRAVQKEMVERGASYLSGWPAPLALVVKAELPAKVFAGHSFLI